MFTAFQDVLGGGQRVYDRVYGVYTKVWGGVCCKLKVGLGC